MKLFKNLIAKTKSKFKKKEKPRKIVPFDNSKYYEKILHTLKNERAAISIKFEQSQDPYVSMVLDVDHNRQFIIIDEINSELGHKLACIGEPFVISTKENGMIIFFHTRVLDYGTIGGISFYRLAFPTHIEQLQRRNLNRLKIPHDVFLNADFLIPRHGVVRAKIADISLSGLKLVLPRNVKSIFEHFTKIEHCRIISPFLPANEFSLDIRYCGYDLGTQKTQLGCQFSNLDNTGLKFLSTLTQHLQMPPSLRDN